MIILHVKSITLTHILCVRSRLHTPISTIVHAVVVCAPKILPIGIFLSYTLVMLCDATIGLLNMKAIFAVINTT